MNSNYNVASTMGINLTCSVNHVHSSVATNVTIQWLNSSNHPIHSYTGINNYTEHTIKNVKLSDAGEYFCSFFISTSTPNPYILTSDTTTTSTDVVLTSKCIFLFCYSDYFVSLVPNEIETTLSANPIESYYEVGSNVILTCSFSYLKPSYIDISTNVYMHWSHDESEKNSTIIPLMDNTEYYFTYTINNLHLSDAGKYTCTYNIKTENYKPYIHNSATKNDITNITTISKSLNILYINLLVLYSSI